MEAEFNRKADYWPTDPRALKRLEREIELGNFGISHELALHNTPRYLVTYMKSRTGGRVRSATVVTVTNQSRWHNRVWVSYFKGLTDNSSPVCVSAFAIPPEFTIDFCSRTMPSELTTCNSTCASELLFDEGRAIVSSTYPELGVSARVYYTSGDQDSELLAITDSKVVAFGKGNNGD